MTTFTIDIELRGKHGQLLLGNFEAKRAMKMLELFLECEELAASDNLSAAPEAESDLAGSAPALEQPSDQAFEHSPRPLKSGNGLKESPTA